MAATTPKSIILAIKNAIQTHFSLGDDQVAVANAKVPIQAVTWHDDPYILVTPGPQSVYGDGNGGQDGGNLFRQMSVNMTVYTRTNLDQFGESEVAILKSQSILDYSEALVTLFRETYLGQNPYSYLNGLLMEQIYFQSSSAPDWEDQNLGILYQDNVFNCVFETQPLDYLSLFVPTPQTSNA